jgi:DNA-directed RNA polymerase specialized sigma24 family protein
MNNQTKRTQLIIGAFNSLSETEVKSLGRAASRLISGTTFSEPDDLFHEALVRTLDGRRNYPSQVSFGLYMNLTMRSIADGDRDLRGNVDPGPDFREQETDDSDDAAIHEPVAPSAEDEFVAMETLERIAKAVGDIRDSLGDDDVACAVLDGIIFEELPQETRKARGLGVKAYDAARKRLERRLHPLRDAFLTRKESPERSRTRRRAQFVPSPRAQAGREHPGPTSASMQRRKGLRRPRAPRPRARPKIDHGALIGG